MPQPNKPRRACHFAGAVALLACAGFVLWAPRARACERLPALWFTPLGVGRAVGPLVFGVECHTSNEGFCANGDVNSLQIEEAPGVLVLGSFEQIELAGGTPLVRFIPDTPLQDGVQYTISDRAVEDFAWEAFSEFYLRPAELGVPLDAVLPVESWSFEPVGERYACALAPIDHSDCFTGPYDLRWSLAGKRVSSLTVTLPSRDGFLFRASSSETPVGNAFGFAPDLHDETAPLTPGVETCLWLEALNVYDLQRTRREVCLTGNAPDGGESVELEQPSLADCVDPPQHADVAGTPVAADLLGAWCDDRKMVCDAPDGYSDCAAYALHCPLAEDCSGTVEATPDDAPPPLVQPSSMPRHGSSSCSAIPSRPSTSAALWWLLALLWLTAKLRQGRASAWNTRH